MSFLIEQYAQLFERRRWLVALLVVVLTVVTVSAIPRLRTNDNMAALFMEGRRGQTAGDDGVRVNENLCLVVLESDELFTPQGLSVVRDLHSTLSETEGVDRVTSLYDIHRPVITLRRVRYRRMFPSERAGQEDADEFRELASEHPMIQGQLLSDDGRATLLLLELDPERRTSDELRPVIDRIEEQVAERIVDESFASDITGPTLIQVRMADALIRDQIVFNIAGPVVAILIAFVLFRRPSSVLIVTAAPILGVVWTLGWFALSGEELNPINGVVAPLALTIGLTDAVHMMLHIRQGIATGSTPQDAAGQAIRYVGSAGQAIRHVGAACALTSLTTAIGFASLGTADLEVLQRFGIDCAVAVVAAFVAVVTVVPLLGSTWIGARTVTKSHAAGEEKQHALPRWHAHVVRFAIQHRVPVLVGGVVVTGLLVWYAGSLEMDARLQRGLPEGSPTQEQFLRVDELFNGSLPFMLVVEWESEAPPELDELVEVLTAAHATLAGRTINSEPLSVLTIVKAIPGEDRSPERLRDALQSVPDERLSLFYNEEEGQALILTRFRDIGSDEIEELLDEMDQTLAEVSRQHPDFSFHTPDSLPIALRSASSILVDLVNSLFMAVPVTLVVIAVAFRSLRFGLLSLLPNIFPMAALAGTMLLLGIPLQLTGATVFVMCFGIAVDDTIHALTVFRRMLREGVPAEEAIEKAFEEIGNAVLSTTMILIAGISVVMLGQSVMTQYFGGLFIGGLLWAIVGDLLLLPAVLACFPPRQRTGTKNADG